MSTHIYELTRPGLDSAFVAVDSVTDTAFPPLFTSRLAAMIWDAEMRAGRDTTAADIEDALDEHFSGDIPEPDEVCRPVGDGTVDREPLLSFERIGELWWSDRVIACECPSCEADDRESCGCRLLGLRSEVWGCATHRRRW